MKQRRSANRLSWWCLPTALYILAGPSSAAEAASPDVVWVWSGAVTTNSAVVKAKLQSGVRQAKLRVHPTADPDTLIEIPANGFEDADPNGVVTFKVARLEPATEYRYVVETNGGSGPSGRFHTFADGPMSFRLGFASCATTGSNHRIFDTLRELNRSGER